jgi:peptidyl-prolyl cis-trans isomerase B (cyclophilin B)
MHCNQTFLRTTIDTRAVTLGFDKIVITKFRSKKSWMLFVFSLLGVFYLSGIPAICQPQDPVVVMQTTKGPIVMRIYVNAVPNTSRNFLDLVDRGFYNGLMFHRIETWCIQGGDPTGTGNGNYIDPATGQPRFIPLEINQNLSHNSPGVVAMARSNNPNSASCQFYITKAVMRGLDRNYAIFGHVLDGMQAVYNMGRGDKIISAQIVHDSGPAPSTARPAQSRPAQSTDSGF